MKSRGRRLDRLVTACFSCLVLAGCGSVRYPTSYILHLPPPAPRTAAVQDAFGPLAIQELRCPVYLCEGRIVYRPTPEEVGFYEYHRWAMSPSQVVTQFFAETIRARSLFREVTVHDLGIEAAYVLTGSMERLEELDHGRDVQAVCTISAQLLDVRAKSIVWSHTETARIPVHDRSVPGVVTSLSAATRMTVERLVTSMEASLTSGLNPR